MFSFLHVNKVLQSGTAETGNGAVPASRIVAKEEEKEPKATAPPAEQRVQPDRRQGGDRRQKERNCTIGNLYDTRAKTPRRKASRRQEDTQELRQFKIEI